MQAKFIRATEIERVPDIERIFFVEFYTSLKVWLPKSFSQADLSENLASSQEVASFW